jgi:2-iminobutanoate/2-iminopropanoate deaminase
MRLVVVLSLLLLCVAVAVTGHGSHGSHGRSSLPWRKVVVNTTDAPAAIGPYSQGIRAGNLLYVSGSIGLDPKTGDFTSHEITGQTDQSMKNLRAIVLAGGSSMDQVLKTTVLMQNLSDFATMNAVYAKYFTSDPPARATFQVGALPRGALVEIECVALIPEPEFVDDNQFHGGIQPPPFMP